MLYRQKLCCQEVKRNKQKGDVISIDFEKTLQSVWINGLLSMGKKTSAGSQQTTEQGSETDSGNKHKAQSTVHRNSLWNTTNADPNRCHQYQFRD